jgi:uncharacterized protein YacL
MLDRLWFKYRFILIGLILAMTIANLILACIFKLPVSVEDVISVVTAFGVTIYGLTYKEKE